MSSSSSPPPPDDSDKLSWDQIQQWMRQEGLAGTYQRAVHTLRQVRAMEWVFMHHSQYPSTQLKRALAVYLSMSYTQLQKWFQTRRQQSTPTLLSRCHVDKKEWAKTSENIRRIIAEASLLEESDPEVTHPTKKRKTDPSLHTPPTPPSLPPPLPLLLLPPPPSPPLSHPQFC
jgi:hypothetical protein